MVAGLLGPMMLSSLFDLGGDKKADGEISGEENAGFDFGDDS